MESNDHTHTNLHHRLIVEDDSDFGLMVVVVDCQRDQKAAASVHSLTRFSETVSMLTSGGRGAPHLLNLRRRPHPTPHISSPSPLGRHRSHASARVFQHTTARMSECINSHKFMKSLHSLLDLSQSIGNCDFESLSKSCRDQHPKICFIKLIVCSNKLQLTVALHLQLGIVIQLFFSSSFITSKSRS